jgi:NADH:ubiquinone reductase (H+-translocating)
MHVTLWRILMSEKTRIVILGGGYGGIKAAQILYKTFKSSDDVEIILIDRNPFHTLMTELHEVAGGRGLPDSVQVSFRKIFGGRKITITTDKIRAIDFASKEIISGDDKTCRYDYLVLGVGSEPAFYGIPGIKEYSFKLWAYDHAFLLRKHILDMFTLASRENNPEKRKELLTFVVAGAGATGIELAGELLEWSKTLCYSNGIKESEVRIIIIEALDSILPVLPDSLRKKSEKYLKKMGAEIRTRSSITEYSGKIVKIKDSPEIATPTLIWTCGVQACEFGASLDLKKGNLRSSRIETNDFMQSVEHENVYVIGDLNWYMIDGKPIPQVVETALQTAETAAKNIIADIKGTARKKFNPKYHGTMVSIGSHYAVAHLMNVKMSGLPAMAMKHLINIHYLFEIAGFSGSWNYIQHHFLDVKNGRSITGSHH